MSDGTFRSVLNAQAWVCRPRTRRAGDLMVATPTYAVLGEAAHLRVSPMRAGTETTVVGKTPEATAVAYMEPCDLRPGDRLEVIEQTLTLAAEAQVGCTIVTVEDASGVAAGARLHLHHGADAESVNVASVTDGALAVTPALRHAHASGEAVWTTRAHDVGGVCDEAGQGHHLKVLVSAVA